MAGARLMNFLTFGWRPSYELSHFWLVLADDADADADADADDDDADADDDDDDDDDGAAAAADDDDDALLPFYKHKLPINRSCGRYVIIIFT